MNIRAPFPWFGGKSRAAPLVWERFGDVDNYVEPFAGSLAVLLGRPDTHNWDRKTETVNDLDCLLANFWRAVAHDPDQVAHHADWPVNEADLFARHMWLVTEGKKIAGRLQWDPDFYDVKVAGWWVWGICSWIGSGWCSGEGPWTASCPTSATRDEGCTGSGSAGRGVHRKRPHLGGAGRGVHRKLPHLGSAGRGVRAEWSDHLTTEMGVIADRLRRVRVCCGDWTRILGDTPTIKLGVTGVLLDPPYADTADRTAGLYAEDSTQVAHDVRQWAIDHGDTPDLRVALCGYQGEHDMPPDWQAIAWKAHGGYGLQGETRGRANSVREVVWFSPACSDARQPSLFGG